MKKSVLTFVTLLLFAAVGCSHKKDYSSERCFMFHGAHLTNLPFNLYFQHILRKSSPVF